MRRGKIVSGRKPILAARKAPAPTFKTQYDLVLQWKDSGHAPDLPFSEAEMIRKPNALRIRNKNRQVFNRLRPKLARLEIDANLVPKNLSIMDFSLICFDMDGTLITSESLDQLAANCGITASFAEITKKSMTGKIDFEESLRRRMRYFKGLPFSALGSALDQISFVPGDKELIEFVHRYGLKAWIVTGGFRPQAAFVAEKLGMDGFVCNELEEENGILTGEIKGTSGDTFIDARGKYRSVEALARDLEIGTHKAICIGDGANDQVMVRRAGLGIAFHSKPILKTMTPYQIDFCGMDAVINLFKEAWE